MINKVYCWCCRLRFGIDQPINIVEYIQLVSKQQASKIDDYYQVQLYNMKRREIPLSALRTFEAAARNGSFKGAALELGVTSAAVSYQINVLETRIDKRLFNRTTRKVSLTRAGEMLQATMHFALDSISHTLDGISRTVRGRVLTVGVGSSFATRWLAPQLSNFWAQHPDIGLRVVHTPIARLFTPLEVDVAILWGEGYWPDAMYEPLMDVTFTPVCAPVLAQSLRKPKQLEQAHLIHQRDYENWEIWLNAAGVKQVDATSGIVLDDENVALQMAFDGNGVALGAIPLIDAEVSAGRLVKPFTTTVSSPKRYFLLSSLDADNEPNIATFKDWAMEICTPFRRSTDLKRNYKK